MIWVGPFDRGDVGSDSSTEFCLTLVGVGAIRWAMIYVAMSVFSSVHLVQERSSRTESHL